MKSCNLETIGFKFRAQTGFFLLALALTSLFILGCAGMEKKAKKPTLHFLTASKIQPDEQRLEPGLGVLYFYDFFRNIYEMPKEEKISLRGKPGKPILYLDHKFGEKEVFDSGQSRGVGMQMTGYLKFEQAGTYALKANTNDGFRMFLSLQTILDDPNVHSDRFTQPAYVKVPEAGWYPLKILYFQRKGTATLQLFWQKPGDNQFEIVPKKAYAHIDHSR